MSPREIPGASVPGIDVGCIRAQYPTGGDRRIMINGRSTLVTIVEHEHDAMIVGLHPHLLRVPYQDLVR